jgi:predicted lipid-binding transport protein (Tim44 family)
LERLWQHHDRVLGTRSGETENKLRLDINKSVGRWQYAYGAVGQYVQYDSRFFSRVRSEVRDAQGNIVSPQVTVRFQSKLVSITRDKDGKVIDGNAEKVTDITDVWTFARDVSARDPNWKLIATEAGQ